MISVEAILNAVCESAESQARDRHRLIEQIRALPIDAWAGIPPPKSMSHRQIAWEVGGRLAGILAVDEWPTHLCLYGTADGRTEYGTPAELLQKLRDHIAAMKEAQPS